MRFNFDGMDFFEVRDNFIENKNIESVLLLGKRQKECEFSIMIPTYLRNNYLKETLESALDQDTTINYEIVVIDNNADFSDLSTMNIIQQFHSERISYYKNKVNLGMFGNWNRCIELAISPWLLILHDDDRIEKNYITRMMEIIAQNTNTGCVGCNSCIIDQNGIAVPQKLNKRRSFFNNRIFGLDVKDFYYTHPINIMGSAINRLKAIDIGGFDNRWRPTSDYVFILNMTNRYSTIFCNETLFDYRIAVNSSLSLEHLIGMVQVDAFMRKNINEHIHVLNSKMDICYRATWSYRQQGNLLSGSTGLLNESEKSELLLEYNMLNQFLRFPKLTRLDRKLCYLFEKMYGFYARNIRHFTF